MLGLKPLNVGGNASGKPTEEEVRFEDEMLMFVTCHGGML